jgi:hypothetical protein
MAEPVWTITYSLDEAEYTPLQKGVATIELTNKTAHRLLVTQVTLRFDWMGNEYWYRNCNVELGPKQTMKLPSLPFHIELQAPLGATHYQVGVKYRELIESKWVDRGLSYGQRGKHVMIKQAEKRDFTVFISHSNHAKDTNLLDEFQQALKKCGLKPYVAEASPEPGYPLWQKIRQSILNSDALLVLWTKWGAVSGDIREEIGIAVGRGKLHRVIPLLETGEDTKGSLRGLEYIPLDRANANEAISKAIMQILDWARKKEEKRPSLRLKTEQQED